MHKLGLVFVLAGLSLIGLAAVLHVNVPQAGAVPPAVTQLERSLARPGLLALATVDVETLVSLGVAGEGAPGDAEGLPAELAASGIDLRRDVSHATLALSAGAEGRPEPVLALFGRFDTTAVERALRARDDLTVGEAHSGEAALLHVVRVDRETCEESGPWALHVAPERLLVAGPEAIAALLGGAAQPPSDAAPRDLSRFQAFRRGHMVSVALFVPETLPATENPLVGMAAHGARQQIDGFRALYAGAAPRLWPSGVAVDALLEGTRPGVAAEKAGAWQGWLDERIGRLGEKVPTLATLHRALELRAEGEDLHASFRLSRDEIEQLGALPAELGALVFGGMSFQLGGGGAAEEQLAQNPLRFEREISPASLGAYDPSVTFAEPVDQVVGPFGLRLGAVRLLRGESGEDEGPAEIEVEAFATKLPNLGAGDDRVHVSVTRIEGKGGEALLARERCGPDRNELPAALSNHFGGDVLRGAKAVRLRPGAHPDDVARIVGVASVRLPTRTEAVDLPTEASSVERAGTRLEITGVDGDTVAYEVSGDGLLHLRAKNAAGLELADASATSSRGFGGGLSVSQSFAGEIRSLEAVFALDQEQVEFPFELAGTRPGTSGELVEAEPSLVGAVRIRGAFRDWLGRAAAPIALAAASGSPSETPSVRAGPFVVGLEGMWPFGGLMPRVQVRAAAIPGLAESPTALELRLDELRLHDGSVHEGAWKEALGMSQEFGGEALVATSQIETGVEAAPHEVASLHGRVRVRLPARIRNESLPRADLGATLATDDVSLRLVELGRDRFVLRARRGGERVLGARAWNGFDEPLFTQHTGSETAPDGSLDLTFQVRGVPRRIELRVAAELAEAEYPFVLRSGDRDVALVRPRR